MRKPAFPTIPLLLLSTVLLFPSSCTSKDTGGGLAPDFTLEDTSGKKVSLKDLRGQYVIIDFWATWCPPCLMSIPELADLHRKYSPKGLVVLGISLDDPQKVDGRAMSAFKSKHRIDYTILRGSEKVVSDYSKSAGMAIPTMFFVDREGRIVEKLVGFAPGRVEKSIRKLIG
jgi:peroxiredoxin